MTIDSDSTRFFQALRSAIFWPVGVVFVAATVLAIIAFELFSAIEWSEHSAQVLEQARVSEDVIMESATVERGYLLTGDSTFRDRYEKLRDNAQSGLIQLKEIVQDKPEQIQNAQAIIGAMDAWFAHAKIMVGRRGLNMPLDPDEIKVGTTMMDNVRSLFDRFVEKEMELRNQRLAKVDRAKSILSLGGLVLAVLLALTIAYQVRKQMMELAASYRTALTTIEQRQAALARSESDLEAQKEWLRVTLTSIGDGVIVTDPEGRVLLMNHEAEWLTGWTLADALHHPLTEVFNIVNEDTRQTVENPAAKVLIEKKTIGLANHTVLISRNADEWPIEDSAAPILDAKGETLGVVLVFHDATSSRLAQKSLKAYSEELEKTVADRTLTLQQAVSDLQAFSYSVSHDLRSPLRAMQGFSEAVIEDYGDKLDERGRDYLNRIKAAGARLDRLIVDLLSYTRMSRDEAPLEALDVEKIVREIVAADSHLQEPSAEIRVDGPLLKVMGRETALNQVITNLLGNAVKFVREGETPKIRVWSETRDARVRVWIEDKGLGIPKEEQDKIFSMFVQLNDPTKFGGTGVGLALVKKAMQIMRGTVGVESDRDSGSRFWLELAKA